MLKTRRLIASPMTRMTFRFDFSEVSDYSDVRRLTVGGFLSSRADWQPTIHTWSGVVR